MRDRLPLVPMRIVLPFMLAVFVTWSVLHTGLPALRHDWRVPSASDEEAPWLGSFFNGWLLGGIGSAQPYPTFYLLGFTLWPFGTVISSFAVMALLIYASIYMAASSGIAIVSNRGQSAFLQCAAALLATLNPWVYTKYVAGHMVQVFAYAALLALVAETTRDKPRRSVLLICSAFAVTQIEFFAVACLPLVVWAWRRHERRVMAVFAIAAAPIALGITASFGEIRETPLNLVWQQFQSLPPASALALSGYFTHYARSFEPFEFVAYAFGIWAIAAIPLAVRHATGRFALIVAAALLLLTTGTKGPVAPLYDWLVLNVAAVGLFRELYDLIALVVIAYIILISYGSARFWFAGLLLTAGAICWFVPWVSDSPAKYFVAAQLIPRAPNPAPPSSRVAYLPAFQPFSFEGRGAGVDPDGYIQQGHGTPLNEFFPTFPVDAALGYLQRGDTREAQSLGVSAVVVRPYLRSSFSALRYQLVGNGAAALSPRLRSNEKMVALPIVGVLANPPREAALANRLDDNAIFFGDRNPRLVAPFVPSRETKNPSNTWVDARLAVPLRPELGNAFGGAITAGARPIAIPVGEPWNAVLADADGALLDDRGRTVVKDSRQLAWRRLAVGVKALQCHGTCAVVLAGIVPPGMPDHVQLGPLHGLSAHFAFPWIASALVPAGMSGTVRFAERYDRSWIAVDGDELLPHERLATVLNAWTLPKAEGRSRTLYLIELVAAFQFLLELIAAGTLIAFVAQEEIPKLRGLAQRLAPGKRSAQDTKSFEDRESRKLTN